MKTPKFVELSIYNGQWGVYTLINMDTVAKIAPEKNWTRITYKNGKSDLITKSYREVVDELESA